MHGPTWTQPRYGERDGQFDRRLNKFPVLAQDFDAKAGLRRLQDARPA